MNGFAPEVVIREAQDADELVLRALAERDSARVPQRPLLVAELDGALQAAISLSDGRVVADPFRRTAELVSMLETRASQLLRVRSTPSGSRSAHGLPHHRPAAGPRLV